MFSIPTYVILIPFALVAAIMAFFACMNIINLLRYGARNTVGFIATFVFLCGAAAIVFFVWRYLPDIGWTEPIRLAAPPVTI